VNRILTIIKAFGAAIRHLRNGRLAVPLALYFLLKLGIILAYAFGPAGATAAVWRIFRPGQGGEALSHYPDRLIVMPIMLGRLDIPLEVLVLSFAQGITVVLVALAARRERVSFAAAAARTRYVHLAVAAAVVSAAMFVVFRYPLSLLDRLAGVPRAWELALGVSAGIVVQALFIYAVPFIVLDGRSSIDALRRSVAFAARHPVESLALVALPFALTVPTLLLTLNPQAVAFQLSPEFLVQVQIAGEFVEFATGYLLVGGLTLYLLDARSREEKR